MNVVELEKFDGVGVTCDDVFVTDEFTVTIVGNIEDGPSPLDEPLFVMSGPDDNCVEEDPVWAPTVDTSSKISNNRIQCKTILTDENSIRILK